MAERSVTPNLLDDKQELPPTSYRLDTDVTPPGADLVQQRASGTVEMFERLARDSSVDVEKLQRLIDMQKDILRHQAEGEFWAAFAEMQGDLPTIDEDGKIVVDGKVRSQYSTNEHIQEVIRPILKRHGFALSFRNATSEKGLIKVTGILAHRGGHKESDSFDSAPDSGGSMNNIQRIGSTRSYGARYTTISLCNIVSRAKLDRDDDGGRLEKHIPPPPVGYEAWLGVMEGVAAQGQTAWDDAWKQSSDECRRYIAANDPRELASLKVKARKAGK